MCEDRFLAGVEQHASKDRQLELGLTFCPHSKPGGVQLGLHSLLESARRALLDHQIHTALHLARDMTAQRGTIPRF